MYTSLGAIVLVVSRILRPFLTLDPAFGFCIYTAPGFIRLTYTESLTSALRFADEATARASSTVIPLKSGTAISSPCLVTTDRNSETASTMTATKAAARSRFFTIQLPKKSFMLILLF